jgi:hypothetical protein
MSNPGLLKLWNSTPNNPFCDSGFRVTKEFGLHSELTDPKSLKWSDSSKSPWSIVHVDSWSQGGGFIQLLTTL